MKKIIIPKEVLEEEFIKNNKNVSKTAKSLNYSVDVVVSNLDDYNIERNRSKRKTNYLYRDKDWLHNEYCILETPIVEIAIKCNTTTDVLYDWINKYCLEKRFKTLNIEYEELYELYVCLNKSTIEISKIYDVSPTTIAIKLKESGIKIRTYSESQNIYLYEKGGIEKSSISQKLVWEREGYKDKMSNIHREIHRNNPNLAIEHSAKLQGIKIEDWTGFKEGESIRIRRSFEYNQWRKKVLDKYNHTCQKCGSLVDLNVHHIENFSANKDKRFDVLNGIVLCDKCHLGNFEGSFHRIYGIRNNNKKQLDEFLKN